MKAVLPNGGLVRQCANGVASAPRDGIGTMTKPPLASKTSSVCGFVQITKYDFYSRAAYIPAREAYTCVILYTVAIQKKS
jgi:hypothetical protein